MVPFTIKKHFGKTRAESCVLLTWIFAILAGSGDVSGSGFSEMFFYGAGSRAVYADRI